MISGKWLILGVFGTALVAAAAAWAVRYSQTNQMHALWGTPAVVLMLHAPNLRVIELEDRGVPPEHAVSERRSVNARGARGLINIRHLLTIDSSYEWQTSEPADSVAQPWHYALEFADDKSSIQLLFSESCRHVSLKDSPSTILLIEPAAHELKSFFEEQLR